MKKREVTISLPELGMVGVTRLMLGAGIGMLLSERFNSEERKAIGWTLVGVGTIASIPIGLELLGALKSERVPAERASLRERWNERRAA